MVSSSYVSIRDDSGLKSLSRNERDFLRSCALASNGGRVLRGDGRGPGDVRKVRLNLGRWHNGAECTVQWGTGTRVTALVTADLLPPLPDRPSEGTVSVSVDLSPMASTSFGHAQPLTTTPSGGGGSSIPTVSDETQKLLSNRILRSLERTLLVGGALDTEALCVQSGSWVWRLNVHVTALDHGGNLLDASVLAAVAALRHYRKPQVNLVESTSDDNINDDDNEKVHLVSPTLLHSDAREPTPLPLHHTPLSISFALIHSDDAFLATSSTSTVAALVDPTDREELVQTGSISLAMNVHSEVCLLDFGGGCELRPAQLKQCWKLGQTSILQLCNMLEKTLTDADDKAQDDRLQRLRKASASAATTSLSLDATSLPTIPHDGMPFLIQNPPDTVDTITEWKDVSDDVANAATQVKKEEGGAEEAYRLQALDYSLGHVAAKVKEAPSSKNKGGTTPAKANAMAGSLLAAMLKSAQNSAAQEKNEETSATITATATASNPWLPESTSDGRQDTQSLSQKDEFEQFAKKQKQAAKATTPPSAVPVATEESDNEEVTTVLKSEFQSIAKVAPKQSSEQKEDLTKAQPTYPMEDGDVDDLAMAITKKKKKKKSKKSK